MEDGLIPNNPAKSSRLSNPGKASKARQALDRETLAEIVSKLHLLEENDRRFLALAIFTGMRRGEIIGHRWEDIDLVNNVIHVLRSANINKGKAIIGETKTASGKRDIPIAPDLLRYLKPLKAAGYVIVGTRDKSGEEPISCTIYTLRRRRQRPQGPGPRHRRAHRHIPGLPGRSDLRLHHRGIYPGSPQCTDRPV